MRSRRRDHLVLRAVPIIAAALVLTACGPPAPTGLTVGQCEQFEESRWTLEMYTSDAWGSFADEPNIMSGSVARVVGNINDDAEVLVTPATEASVEAVLEAGREYARLASEYGEDFPVAVDDDDLAKQDEVREGLLTALADCPD